jgi:hypothetical protein
VWVCCSAVSRRHTGCSSLYTKHWIDVVGDRLHPPLRRRPSCPEPSNRSPTLGISLDGCTTGLISPDLGWHKQHHGMRWYEMTAKHSIGEEMSRHYWLWSACKRWLNKMSLLQPLNMVPVQKLGRSFYMASTYNFRSRPPCPKVHLYVRT